MIIIPTNPHALYVSPFPGDVVPEVFFLLSPQTELSCEVELQQTTERWEKKSSTDYYTESHVHAEARVKI